MGVLVSELKLLDGRERGQAVDAVDREVGA
jgi:hypothetical protein